MFKAVSFAMVLALVGLLGASAAADVLLFSGSNTLYLQEDVDALFQSVISGDADSVTHYLACGIPPNVLNGSLRTPLGEALMLEKTEVLPVLMEHGGEVSTAQEYQMLAYDLLDAGDIRGAEELLMAKPVDFNEDRYLAWMLGAFSVILEDPSLMTFSIDRGLPLDVVHPELGYDLMELALRYRHFEMLFFLLENTKYLELIGKDVVINVLRVSCDSLEELKFLAGKHPSVVLHGPVTRRSFYCWAQEHQVMMRGVFAGAFMSAAAYVVYQAYYFWSQLPVERVVISSHLSRRMKGKGKREGCHEW